MVNGIIGHQSNTRSLGLELRCRALRLSRRFNKMMLPPGLRSLPLRNRADYKDHPRPNPELLVRADIDSERASSSRSE